MTISLSITHSFPTLLAIALPESVDAIDDFGDILLFIQVCQLEPKDLRQTHNPQCFEKVVDVV